MLLFCVRAVSLPQMGKPKIRTDRDDDDKVDDDIEAGGGDEQGRLVGDLSTGAMVKSIFTRFSFEQ